MQPYDGLWVIGLSSHIGRICEMKELTLFAGCTTASPSSSSSLRRASGWPSSTSAIPSTVRWLSDLLRWDILRYFILFYNIISTIVQISVFGGLRHKGNGGDVHPEAEQEKSCKVRKKDEQLHTHQTTKHVAKYRQECAKQSRTLVLYCSHTAKWGNLSLSLSLSFSPPEIWLYPALSLSLRPSDPARLFAELNDEWLSLSRARL